MAQEVLMLETHDIQGLILSGYKSQPHANYIFLSLRNGADPKPWLGDLLNRVTPAEGFDRNRSASTNIAISYKGFVRLGLGEGTLATFSRAFIEDMSNDARAQLLGDHPEDWSWGKQGHNIHVLLMLFAKTGMDLADLRQRELRIAQTIFDEVLSIDSQVLPLPGGKLNHEHFGFVDGLAQPTIVGYREEKRAANGPGSDVRAGEFILGYENEYGQRTASPHLRTPDNDQAGILPDQDLGRNGTYLVIRQMEQDVAGFWKMIRSQCARPDGTPDLDTEEELSAKIIGRWRDGRPLAVPDPVDPTRLNDFGFAKDPYGQRCPIGAHIRRANPREMLLADPKESVTTLKRHRVLRRGRPYGPEIQDRYTPDGLPRGLVFAVLNANIERQFEFIQHAWISSPNFAGMYDEADPLLGGRTESSGAFTIQKCPVRERRTGIESHITVKGGAYFFVPGLKALRYLSLQRPGSRP